MEIRFLTPLTPQEQLAHGLAAAQPLAMADRVRFSEVDSLNHVNNKAYMEWFETLRVHYHDQFCAPFYQGLTQPKYVLRNASIHYIREMRIDETHITTARVSEFRTSSYTTVQEIWSDGELRATLSAVMVMLSPDGARREPIIEPLLRHFEENDGAVRQAVPA